MMAKGRTSRGAGDEAAAKAAELLALGPEADPLARLRELAGDAPRGATALVDALGASGSADAAPILAAIAERTPDKELRKAARRALHRLQSVGVAAPLVPRTPRPDRTMADHPRLIDAPATATDGVGSRLVWLGLEPPTGGLLGYSLLLNDVVGMKDCLFAETTRRKFQERVQAFRAHSKLTVVTLPGDYAVALVSEALALNRESGVTVPRDYLFHQAALGELPPPPTDALIHRYVSRGQAFLLPDLLESAEDLLEEAELDGWLFGYKETKDRAHELRRSRESRLILTAEPPEARERRIVDAAVDELFTPTMRRAMRRRLEEVAYVFWATGRERTARQAVAAAGALGAGSLRGHAFARAMVLRSLEIAAEAEQAGGIPAFLDRSPYDPID